EVQPVRFGMNTRKRSAPPGPKDDHKPEPKPAPTLPVRIVARPERSHRTPATKATLPITRGLRRARNKLISCLAEQALHRLSHRPEGMISNSPGGSAR